MSTTAQGKARQVGDTWIQNHQHQAIESLSLQLRQQLGTQVFYAFLLTFNLAEKEVHNN